MSSLRNSNDFWLNKGTAVKRFRSSASWKRKKLKMTIRSQITLRMSQRETLPRKSGKSKMVPKLTRILTR